MNKAWSVFSAIVFMFLLMGPSTVIAHDDEHEAKGGHGRDAAKHEMMEEGSGSSALDAAYEEGKGKHGEMEKGHESGESYSKHGKSESGHGEMGMEEGSGGSMGMPASSAPPEPKEEGSGMR